MPIDHLGIAVSDLTAALAAWAGDVGAPEGPLELVEGQGVRVAFLNVGGVHLELLEPVDPASPVARFIEKRGEGLHHIALHVPSVQAALDRAKAGGAKLVDSVPRPGARGRRVGFVHPSAHRGVLLEFVEGP